MRATAVEHLVGVLRARRFMFTNEEELQAGVGIALTEAGLESEREVVLSAGDRIDFVVGTVGVECKIDHGRAALLRQLFRYAQTGKLTAIVVVLGKMSLATLPESIQGVPIHVVLAARAFA